MLDFVLAILLVVFVISAAKLNAIETNWPCDEELNKLEADRAKVQFIIPTGFTSAELWAINSECYRCSKSLVATNNTCASLFTPHLWRLYLVESNTNGEGKTYSSLKYTFGEQGEYTISSSDDNSLNVDTTKEPIDSMQPFYILLGCLCFVGVLAFVGPVLWSKLRNNQNNDDFSELNSISYTGVNTKDPLMDGKVENSSSPSPPKKKSQRLSSLDTFRGIALCLMIFVNYGGGGYWFFEHADWNGLTLADLVFPWFMWIMGVSMALSFVGILPRDPVIGSDEAAFSKIQPVPFKAWKHITRRSIILFLLGMFLANGWEYTTWRVPGVLQYFAVSYFVTSCTVLAVYPQTQAIKLRILEQEENERSMIANNWTEYKEKSRLQTIFDTNEFSKIMTAYRYEWMIQAIVLIIYLSVSLGAKAPGCPRGYRGPGGISDHSAHYDCTGGIHRYIDMHAFGYDFIYHHPTCLAIYQCIPYDPEGLLGSLSACTLTYLGLMVGRMIIHFKGHADRLKRWILWSFVLLLIGGGLCGFSKELGVMPLNKNLWSTSFVLVAAGLGMIGLSICYVIVDIYKVWTGAPFLYLGMNSILIYCSHGILAGYMPFSYKIYDINHGTLLMCNVLGVTSWIIIAWYFYHIKFFVKI